VKKIMFLFAFGLIFLFSVNGASASEKEHYPSDKEIEALNQELQELVDKANEKLENGENNFEIEGETLTLGFKESSSMGRSAIGSKEYQAYITNTIGFNFTHAVSGLFSWNGDYLTALTAKADLTGIAYDKSHTTTKEGLDGLINGSSAKVGRVTSEGKFKELKFFTTYYTTLIVDVYAPTQSYRIIRADIQY